jgi:hypothetical protein
LEGGVATGGGVVREEKAWPDLEVVNGMRRPMVNGRWW